MIKFVGVLACLALSACSAEETAQFEAAVTATCSLARGIEVDRDSPVKKDHNIILNFCIARDQYQAGPES